jgi:anti-sigma regulatory factor (Ser/Thr protein kinase)/anti-anti-sigma regulatory factor
VDQDRTRRAAVTPGRGGPDRARLRCITEYTNPVAVIRFAGGLDLHGAVDVRSALHKALAGQPLAIVADLTEMTVVDDTALLVFRTFARTAAQWPGCPVLLCVPDPVLHEHLERLAMDRVAQLHASRRDALAAAEAVPASAQSSQRLPAGVASAVVARQAVRDACAAWQLRPLVDDAELVVTELVSNAVRHAGGDMDLVIALRGGYLWLSVRDGSAELPCRVMPDPETGEGGRGLILLDAVAADWGTTAVPEGKIVWATLRLRR